MFDHILVPLDGSCLAECVLPHTVALARAFDAQVTLLRVVERTRTLSPARAIASLHWQIGKSESKAYLQEIATRLCEIGLQTKRVVLEGQAAERITEFTQGQNVSLIVLSSHGRSGLSRWNVGSVAQKVILRACVSTMIVRAYQPVPSGLADLQYRRLLVPLDGSQRAGRVLPLATALARFHESQLLLAHAVSRPEVPRHVPLSQKETKLVSQVTESNRLEAARYLEELRSHLSSKVQTRLLVCDNVAAVLHDLVAQENVDLITLSAHGCSSGTKWPYGGIALNFIAYGSTPLLIVQDRSRDELERTRVEMAARERKRYWCTPSIKHAGG